MEQSLHDDQHHEWDDRHVFQETLRLMMKPLINHLLMHQRRRLKHKPNEKWLAMANDSPTTMSNHQTLEELAAAPQQQHLRILKNKPAGDDTQQQMQQTRDKFDDDKIQQIKNNNGDYHHA